MDASRTPLGRYELLFPIGAGGMGTVYAARMRGPAGFQKRVAIKRIHPHLAAQPAFVEMFLDEARIAAAVHHPNVAAVLDLGEEGGEPFIAMEYLHGEHLGAVSARMGVPLSPCIGARVVSLAAAGLHHAHDAKDERGRPLALVHRDVSPQNVFITYDGHVKVTDFGIARAEGRLTETHSGRIKGKTAYVSPEQVLGDRIDRRADVFALGVVLWEITTGARLFGGGSDAETLFRIANHEVRDPRDVVPAYPNELAAIVEKALSRRPVDRYATAADMARALEAFLASTEQSVGTHDLAATMGELFHAERCEKELRFVASAEAHAGGPEVRRVAPEPDPPPSGPPRVRRWLLAGALAGALAVVFATLWTAQRPIGRVRIDTTPSGAAVVVDGVVQPTSTPTVVAGLEHGSHDVMLELDGHTPRLATFELDRDELELSYRLIEIDASAPEAARAPSNEEGREEIVDLVEAPAVIAREPPPQVATRPGADSPVAGAEPPRPAPVRARARSREPARLSLLSRPWATVRINGHDAGRTPVIDRSVPSGRLRIELRAGETGEIQRLTVVAEPGESVHRSVSFE